MFANVCVDCTPQVCLRITGTLLLYLLLDFICFRPVIVTNIYICTPTVFTRDDSGLPVSTNKDMHINIVTDESFIRVSWSLLSAGGYNFFSHNLGSRDPFIYI